MVAAILSLNGVKNNPKIVAKITAVRPKGGGASHKAPPPKYATGAV